MYTLDIPQLMIPAPELIETMTGSDVLLGEIIQTPVKIVFDNLGSDSIQVSLSYDDGQTLIPWKTFAGGTALILDADKYTFSKGVQLYANGAGGDFSVAYTYLKQWANS